MEKEGGQKGDNQTLIRPSDPAVADAAAPTLMSPSSLPASQSRASSLLADPSAPSSSSPACDFASGGSTAGPAAHAARTAELLRLIFSSASAPARAFRFVPFRSSSSSSGTTGTRGAAGAAEDRAVGGPRAKCTQESPQSVSDSGGDPRASPGKPDADAALKALQAHLRQASLASADDGSSEKSLYAAFSRVESGDRRSNTFSKDESPRLGGAPVGADTQAPVPSPSRPSLACLTPASALDSSSCASASGSRFSASSSEDTASASASVSVLRGVATSVTADASARGGVDGLPEGVASADARDLSSVSSASASLDSLTQQARMRNFSGAPQASARSRPGLSLPLGALPASAAAALVSVKPRVPPGLAVSSSQLAQAAASVSPLPASAFPAETAHRAGGREVEGAAAAVSEFERDVENPACTEKALRALLQEWPVLSPAAVAESVKRRQAEEARAAEGKKRPRSDGRRTLERDDELDGSHSLFQERVACFSRLSQELRRTLRFEKETTESEEDAEKPDGSKDDADSESAAHTEAEGAKAKRHQADRDSDERCVRAFDDALSKLLRKVSEAQRRHPWKKGRPRDEEEEGYGEKVAVRAIRRSFLSSYRPLPPAPAKPKREEAGAGGASPPSSPASSASPPYGASWSLALPAETEEAASLFALLDAAHTQTLAVQRKFASDQERPSPSVFASSSSAASSATSSPSSTFFASPSPASSFSASSSSASPPLASSARSGSTAGTPPAQAPSPAGITVKVRHINEGVSDLSLWMLGSAHAAAWRAGIRDELLREASSGEQRKEAEGGGSARGEPAAASGGAEDAQEKVRREEEHLQRLKDVYVGTVRKLQRLSPDELIEGSFIIDRVIGPEEIQRTIMFGRHGRREFLQVLERPGVVVRGWVVRCDSSRALLLVRLVAAEVYPLPEDVAAPSASTTSSSPAPTREAAARPGAGPPASASAAASASPVSASRRRLLRTECDIGSSGLYGALPLAAIGPYECKGGQASGCVGRFLPVGTAIRACLADFQSASSSPFGRSGAPGAKPSVSSRASSPRANESGADNEGRLDDATLNDAHAHVLLTLRPPLYLAAPDSPVPLQKPLGFTAAHQQDSLFMRCQYEDYFPIVALQPPTLATAKALCAESAAKEGEAGTGVLRLRQGSSGPSAFAFSWWDGGASLLRQRLPFILFSDPRVKNYGGLGHKLRLFDLLRSHFFSFALSAGVFPATCRWRKTAAEAERELQQRREETRRLEKERRALLRERRRKAAEGEGSQPSAEEDEEEPHDAEEDRYLGLGTFLTDEQSNQWAQQRLQQGVAAARKGDLGAAMECYEAALLLKPKYIDALVARGAAHANRLDYEKALEDLNAALAQEPQHPNALKYRRIVLLRMANQKKSEEEASGAKKTAGHRAASRTPSPTTTRAKMPPQGLPATPALPGGSRLGAQEVDQPHVPTAVSLAAGGGQLAAAGVAAGAQGLGATSEVQPAAGFSSTPRPTGGFSSALASGFSSVPTKGFSSALVGVGGFSSAPSGFSSAPPGGFSSAPLSAGGFSSRPPTGVPFNASVAAAAAANAAAAASAINLAAAEKERARLLALQGDKRLSLFRNVTQKELLMKQQLAHAMDLEQRVREKRLRAEQEAAQNQAAGDKKKTRPSEDRQTGSRRARHEGTSQQCVGVDEARKRRGQSIQNVHVHLCVCVDNANTVRARLPW
ncbi:tetratricopeptide repeat-containing protein [Besnoitia besnoiti]|uniref:Tetratricopeptide repeat-containing protein n=1 Tax=Besnoitia besnoiti TaxID=94643 RepID=A0A2A9MP66_BESBE|nr:tetratricopeptide repeat-containing protein [Besnoitia besnoiti]PFH37813.1 tetratricopeptide repeat-containing protein [Besnoitia besnoiti]